MAESTPATNTAEPQTADQTTDDTGGENTPAEHTLDEMFEALADDPDLPDARRFKVSQEMLGRLDNMFVYHGAGPDQAKRYEFIRARARAFAQVIVTLTPPSREQSLAITALEEAVMRANQAIAVNE
ncbi:MAG: hypothetical protein AB7U76_26320 [Pirellulales bacterium]